jgi:hypothetical protein
VQPLDVLSEGNGGQQANDWDTDAPPPDRARSLRLHGYASLSDNISQLCEPSGAHTACALNCRIYANSRHRSRSRSRLWLVVRYVNDNTRKNSALLRFFHHAALTYASKVTTSPRSVTVTHSTRSLRTTAPLLLASRFAKRRFLCSKSLRMHGNGFELRTKCIISGVDTSTVHQLSQSNNRTFCAFSNF